MKTAVLAFTLFLAALLLHVIIWRLKLPRRHTAALLVVLLGTLPIGLAAVCFLPAFAWFGPLDFWQIVQVGIFHIAMSLAYIVAYTLIEERSPSMTLTAFVADAKGRGRSGEQLVALLSVQSPVERRVSAMLRDGMVVENEAGMVELTAKGWAWARGFSIWRHLLRMEKGG